MLQIDSSQILGALGVACTLVLTVVGYLLVRTLKGIDKSIEKQSAKIDALGSTDTELKVQLRGMEVAMIEVRARVTALEIHVREHAQ